MLHVAGCMLLWRVACCMLAVLVACRRRIMATRRSLCLSVSPSSCVCSDQRCTPRDCHHTAKGGGGRERVRDPIKPKPKPESQPNWKPEKPTLCRGSPRVAFCASIKPNKYYLCIFWVIVSTPPRCAWTPLASFL